MSNPQMPHIPGAAVMTDTLDFVKNLWGSMSVPGLTAPTLSVDELDKKINDLKAVETWLNLNMSMLRGSIQALEVQRGTIATLKSMGASLAAAVNQNKADNKSMLDTIPYASVFFQQPPAKVADKPAAPAPRPAPAKEAPAAEASAPSAGAQEASASDTSAAAQMANPAIWWNMLQDQFKQAVAGTLSTEAMTTAAGKMAAAATAATTAATQAATQAATNAAKAASAATSVATSAAANAATKAASNMASNAANAAKAANATNAARAADTAAEADARPAAGKTAGKGGGSGGKGPSAKAKPSGKA